MTIPFQLPEPGDRAPAAVTQPEPADATRVASSSPEALIEKKVESSEMEKKEKLPRRFKSKDEWRAHMDTLADDGKWTKRNWTK